EKAMAEPARVSLRCLYLLVPILAFIFSIALVTRSADAGFEPLQQTNKYDSSLYSGLHWRNVGPFRPGPATAVTGVIGQPSVYYFGSVGGGVWKTTNTGRTWTPIFDSQSVGSIGGIGVAPSNPNIVYVGTGEADLRDSISFGNGMYKSTDAGK